MSKVYRYLLKSNEEQLVNLRTELSFISSYYYLLKARYGEGIDLAINVPEKEQELMIPPLTLQIIFENTLNQNTISKSQPLKIEIYLAEQKSLEIKNSHQPRISTFDSSTKGLENISNKFLLLGQDPMNISCNGKERIIRLPLIPNTQMNPA